MLNRPGASPHRLKTANVSAEDGWWLCHRWSLLNKFELWATEQSGAERAGGSALVFGIATVPSTVGSGLSSLGSGEKDTIFLLRLEFLLHC